MIEQLRKLDVIKGTGNELAKQVAGSVCSLSRDRTSPPHYFRFLGVVGDGGPHQAPMVLRVHLVGPPRMATAKTMCARIPYRQGPRPVEILPALRPVVTAVATQTRPQAGRAQLL